MHVLCAVFVRLSINEKNDCIGFNIDVYSGLKVRTKHGHKVLHEHKVRRHQVLHELCCPLGLLCCAC